MRLWPLLLLPLAACAGNVLDYAGSRAGIVTPQLIRFGFDLGEARCVGDRLGATVSPLLLRRLVRAASVVRRGQSAPDRLVPRDLLSVAGTVRGGDMRGALALAIGHCGMSPDRVAGNLPRPAPTLTVPAPAVPEPSAWLNLGAAGSGQSIAVDASTLEQDASSRTAWFRLADPGAAAPGDSVFLLRIDCSARTIDARARERRDPAGAVLEHVDYPSNPLPAENGTVMEIAFLALCT